MWRIKRLFDVCKNFWKSKFVSKLPLTFVKTTIPHFKLSLIFTWTCPKNPQNRLFLLLVLSSPVSGWGRRAPNRRWWYWTWGPCVRPLDWSRSCDSSCIGEGHRPLSPWPSGGRRASRPAGVPCAGHHLRGYRGRGPQRCSRRPRMLSWKWNAKALTWVHVNCSVPPIYWGPVLATPAILWHLSLVVLCVCFLQSTGTLMDISLTVGWNIIKFSHSSDFRMAHVSVVPICATTCQAAQSSTGKPAARKKEKKLECVSVCWSSSKVSASFL